MSVVVPFELHFSDANKDYLDSLPLSPEAKARVKQFIQYALATIKDDVRTDQAIRPWQDKPLFVLDFFLVDRWGDDRWHRIEFTVNDSQLSDGKLAVVYVEHTDGDWNG